jgi:hypothetical protein
MNIILEPLLSTSVSDPDSQSNKGNYKGNYKGKSCFDPTLVWFVGLLVCYFHLEKSFSLIAQRS